MLKEIIELTRMGLEVSFFHTSTQGQAWVRVKVEVPPQNIGARERMGARSLYLAPLTGSLTRDEVLARWLRGLLDAEKAVDVHDAIAYMQATRRMSHIVEEAIDENTDVGSG